MTVLPPEVTYARVSGRIIKGVKDSNDPDELPDLSPAVGTITFTPELVGATQWETLPGVLFAPETVVVNLEADGSFDEYLISTDNGDWTYLVTFNILNLALDPIHVHLPGGSTHLITEWIPTGQSTGIADVRGPRGDSAYEVAVRNGFSGTEAQWLASLKGDPGPAGTTTVAWSAITNKPATFPPSTHNHDDLYFTEAETTAAINAASTADRSRANHTGTQTSATISDFTEAVQDAVAAVLAQGTGISLSYNDAGNSLTISATGGTLDAEAVRDAMGVALLGSGLISVAVNDAADTITISTTATANDTNANLRNRSTHTGTQAISTVSGLQTALDGKAGAFTPGMSWGYGTTLPAAGQAGRFFILVP
jgi:hypothetical protein